MTLNISQPQQDGVRFYYQTLVLYLWLRIGVHQWHANQVGAAHWFFIFTSFSACCHPFFTTQGGHTGTIKNDDDFIQVFNFYWRSMVPMSISSGASLLVSFNWDFNFPPITMECLMCPVTARTILTHSPLSELVLPAKPLSFFLQDKAKRLIASWISSVLLIQKIIQSQY